MRQERQCRLMREIRQDETEQADEAGRQGRQMREIKQDETEQADEAGKTGKANERDKTGHGRAGR
jgi:hypothetical protein